MSTSAGFGRNRVAPALSDLAQRYPSLQIQLEPLPGEAFEDWYWKWQEAA